MQIIKPNSEITCDICKKQSDDQLVLIPEISNARTCKAVAVHLNCLDLRYMESGPVTYLFTEYITTKKYANIEPSELKGETHEP